MNQKKSPIKLSIVIPAYNEADRFNRTLPQIINFFKSKKYSKEIIIVNDGSTDNTIAVVAKYQKQTQLIKLVNHKKNQGKGSALRTGIARSVGEWVLFMDADLSTPLKELDNFWPQAKDYPIIIGSRKMTGAKVTKHQSFLRENLGKIFTFLTNNIATRDLSDITCGFKMFKGLIARDLFSKSVLNDWSYDAEILFLAQKNHHQIKEVPVHWQDDPRTKVNMMVDGLKALKGLLQIRLNYFQGRY
jgi:dolichyl-phosphate beta-glucosyltransferase